jgi:hypothetical protein
MAGAVQSGWEFPGNLLMRHVRFVFRLGKKRSNINLPEAILIPPFPGSNPGAPASVSQEDVR